MDLGKFDLVVIVTMSIAIVSMSFTMPALGLTEADTTDSDIPEFSIDSSRFDLSGQFPDNPGTPSQGRLEVTENEGEQVKLEDNETSSIILSAVNDPSTSNVTPDVYLSQNLDGSTDSVNVSLDSLGDTDTISEYGYEIDVQWYETRNENTSDETVIVTWEITDQPGGEGWLTRVPIVGGIVGAGEQLASIVGWIGSIIWWGFTVVLEVLLNVVGTLYDVAVYFIDTMAWLTGTYAEVISSANAWASVFVAIPGVLLFGEFAKVVLVLISLLPTT